MATQQSQAIVEQYAKATASKMEAYIQAKYNVPNFQLKVGVTFAERRKVSRGGTRAGMPFINIVGKKYAEAAESGNLTYFNEYAHIRNDPVIGQLLAVSWQKALSGLIAHEVAHAVQFYPTTKSSAMSLLGIEKTDRNDKMLEKHNWFWQRIYADLRTEFVNEKSADIDAMPIEVTPKTVRPQRIVNKGWKVISQQKGKSRFSYYYTASGDLIGVLCVAPGGYFRYYPDTEKFVKLEVKNFNEARKIEFGL